MPALRKDVDPEGLLEYSVVYTDRALNHMSQSFQGVMNDISSMLKEAYNAEAAVVVPGSGTFGMEAVARQFATGKNVWWCVTAGSVSVGRRSLIWGIFRPVTQCIRRGLSSRENILPMRQRRSMKWLQRSV